MSFGLLFWILMFLILIFSWSYSNNLFGPNIQRFGWWGNNFLLFILLGLLGWAVFGPPIHG